MVKQKHIPIRTCVACRVSDAKKGLLRIVRLADGSVAYDQRGKLAGRGAYLCADTECIAAARKQKKLERALKVGAVPVSLFSELETLAQQMVGAEGRSLAAGNANAVQSPFHETERLHAAEPGKFILTSSAGQRDDEIGGACGGGPQESGE